jgi:hypothetical protein
MNGISSVTDSPRLGQAHREVTPEDIAAVVSHHEGKWLRNSELTSRTSGSWISTSYRP